jgi:hypothetical protein
VGGRGDALAWKEEWRDSLWISRVFPRLITLALDDDDKREIWTSFGRVLEGAAAEFKGPPCAGPPKSDGAFEAGATSSAPTTRVFGFAGLNFNTFPNKSSLVPFHRQSSLHCNSGIPKSCRRPGTPLSAQQRQPSHGEKTSILSPRRDEIGNLTVLPLQPTTTKSDSEEALTLIDCGSGTPV